MSPLGKAAFGLFALTSLVQSALIPTKIEHDVASPARRQTTCTNGPTTRNCWAPGFDINTDFDENSPNTGVTVNYDLRITNTTCDPDGSGGKPTCMLINNQLPGPTIRANWGDTIRVVVHNDLPSNGTGLHWHGVRQLHSMQQDGANGVTECPIAPGATRTYQFRATQYGTSWYHSHHSIQYGEGTVGAIHIDGPTSANYDEDLGPLTLSDWFYDPVFMLNDRAINKQGSPAPPPNNILVNGTMVNGNGGGQYNKITVQQGKTYKLRLINTAVDEFFHVSLDGHPFTVVASDFVPIRPYVTSDLKINIGQRYDVIFTANATTNVTASNYWLRVQPNNAQTAAVFVGGIVSYEGAPDALPTSTGVTLGNNVADESPLVPVWTKILPAAPLADAIRDINVTLDGFNGPVTENVVAWFVNGNNMDVDWEQPTLQYVIDGNTNYTRDMNIIELNRTNEWFYWVIQNQGPPIPHPIHLHGHDFFIAGSGPGAFPRTTAGLNFVNPPRRDVATLPGGGWLVVAFPTDNPGAWLMHCHIAWHVSAGLSMQFLENKDQILPTIGSVDEFNKGCQEWRAWWDGPESIYPDIDSGLKKKSLGGGMASLKQKWA